ncbi:osteocalcin isoform 1-T1 [Dugong dugon]
MVPPTPSPQPLHLPGSPSPIPPAGFCLAVGKASLLPILPRKTWSHLIPAPLCSTAFMSKREGSEVVRRPRRYLDQGLGAPAPYPDPLEPKKEVCELSPDCDELADHIGFQEAYRRFYGTA